MNVENKGPLQIVKTLMSKRISTPSKTYTALGINVPAKQSEQARFWQ